jgi:kynurenine formamidase
MTTPISGTVADTLENIFSQRTIVDLTVALDKSLPCSASGDQNFFLTPRTDYALDQYVADIIITSDHNGTHCDAPSHFVPGKRTLEKMTLSSFMGPCAVIDVTHLSKLGKTDESPVIEVEEVKKWEHNHGELQNDDIVLLYTGWTDMYYKPFPEGHAFSRCHPAPDHHTVQYLVDKGVKHVGIDAVGLGLMQDDAGPHLVACENDMVITEKLINLGQLPPRGAYFMFLPIKAVGATGGLGRAIAIY